MFIVRPQEASSTFSQTIDASFSSSPTVTSTVPRHELAIHQTVLRRSALPSNGYQQYTGLSLHTSPRHISIFSRRVPHNGSIAFRDLTGLSITTNTPSAMPPPSTGYLMIGVVFSCLLALTAVTIGGLVWARNRHIRVRSLLGWTPQRNTVEPKFTPVHLYQGTSHHCATLAPSIKVTLPSPMVSMSTMPIIRSQITARAGLSRHVHTPSPLHAEHHHDLVYAVGRVFDPPPAMQEAELHRGNIRRISGLLSEFSTPDVSKLAYEESDSETQPEDEEEDDYPSLTYGISSDDSNDSTLMTEQLSWLQEHCQTPGSRATLRSVRQPIYMLTDTEGESTECEVVTGIIGKRVAARSIEVKIVEQRFSSSLKFQPPAPPSRLSIPELAVLPPARIVRDSITWRFPSSSPLPWGSSKSLDLDDFPEPPPLSHRSFLQSPIAF